MNLTDKIQVFNQDCMPAMKEFPDNFFDLAIVDPPYGIGINKSGRLSRYGSKKKWDKNIPPDEYFIDLYRISRNQIIWGGNYYNLPPCRGFLIWDKLQPESISFASCEYAYSSIDNSAKTFYKRPQNIDTRIHPTQKPVALYKWILKNYAKPEFKILDTHLGSGSHAIAAHDFGCEFWGYEVDEEYFQAFLKRFKDVTSQTKITF